MAARRKTVPRTKAPKKKAAPRKKPPASTMGALAERLFSIRRERIGLDRQVKELKKQETELGAQLVTAMAKEGIVPDGDKPGKFACPSGTFSYKNTRVARPKDWSEFYDWIARTGNFECLEKRVHQSHVAELLAEHASLRSEGIPGVEFEHVVKTTATDAR